MRRLGDICRNAGVARPMIVTDAGIKRIGMLERMEDQLRGSNIATTCFTDVVADPPEAIVLAALEHAKGCGADGIIGFGGGSSMDTAKLVALMASSGESLDSICGVDQAKGRRLPLILVPTTAGTGSEVTAIAIVTRANNIKAGVVAPQLYPDVALLDAELTSGLPPRITAETGVDAMVHAIEAYTSKVRKNPYSDMLARQALLLLSRNIKTATHQGDHLEARQAMMLGACLAGQAFANAPVAAVHALAYGHLQGDDCLRQVATLLAGTVRRPGEVLARYGGEEFGIVLPMTGVSHTARFGARLCESVQAAGIGHAGSPLGIVTVSVGIASLVPQQGDSPEHLITLADAALYRAKAAGRNQCQTDAPDGG